MRLFVLEVTEINFLLLAPKHNKDVMRHHYEDIFEAISNNPAKIAVTLYTKGFISRTTRKRVTEVSTLTSDDKASVLIEACEEFIITHENPEAMLLKLLDILSETGPVGSNIAKMTRKVSVS